MRRHLLWAILALVSVAPTAVARPISFASPHTFPSGLTHTSRIAVGDFNGDGYPDLAVSSTFNTVAVFLGKGDGTFSGPTIYSLTYYVTGAVAVGDFNGDGKLDLAVVGGDSSGHGVAFLAGNGDGTFQAPVYFKTTLAGGEISAVAADFNHDGNLDLFVGGNGSSEVVLGDGKGNFWDGQYEDGVSGFDVVAGDFNRDGNLDVATTQPYASAGSAGVYVLLGNGDGTFRSPQLYSGMEEPLGIATGDFNGDKKLDLAVTDNEFNTIVTLLGNGDGTFTNIGQWYAGFEPGSIVTADFNMDGKLDLAVTDYGSNALAIFPGKGDGTFPTFFYVAAGAKPVSVVTVDLNRDGSPDLVVVDSAAESVSALLNAAGTFVHLASSPDPSKVGQPVTFTATVHGSVLQSPTPSGAVTFMDGSKALGHVQLSQGQASLTTSSLAKGKHNITAKYSGNETFNPNQSAVRVQTVN